MRAVLATVGLAVVTTAACGSSGGKLNLIDITTKATGVVSAEMRGDYQAASADFTDKAKQRYPVACLAQIHDNLLRDYGAVQRLETPVQTTPGKREITVSVHFASGNEVGGEVSFDRADRVTTLFFARPTKPVGGPPSACPSK